MYTYIYIYVHVLINVLCLSAHFLYGKSSARNFEIVPDQVPRTLPRQVRTSCERVAKEPTNLASIKEKLHNNEHVAMTRKDLTSTVFSFGRDHGHYGRIMNQTVVVEQSLHVKNEHEISGFCFTPQDGNSILSSISAAEWLLYPHSYEDKIQCLSKLFFNVI